MDKNVMSKLLTPVLGQQGVEAVSFVHDLVLAERDTAFREGFDAGITEAKGLSWAKGHDDGYHEGVRDTQNIVGAQAAGAYNAGYDEGYNDGAADDVSAADVYQAGYNAGHLAGWDAAVEDDVTYNDLVNRSH